ncbi:hypothetical protein MTO96_018819 [Rhipicephalus appendiculatus]
MTSDTDRYVKLLNIYHAEADKDFKAVHHRVQQLLAITGKPEGFISEAEVKVFCKNAHALRLVRGRSLAAEYDAKDAFVDTILTSLDSPDSEIIFYLMLRAADRFYSQYNRYPGFFEDQLETDISKLKASLCQEVIKLVTGQYVPLNNTFIFNGMTTTSETFVL